MIILITILLGAAGIVLSFLVNFMCDILPLTVEEPPKKFSFTPFCIHCNENKSWQEYLLFQRCHSCNQKVSYRHWIVLFLLPACFIAGYLYPPPLMRGWIPLLMLLITYFMIVAIIDISYRYVLMSLSIIGWLLTFATGFFIRGVVPTLLGGATALLLWLLLFFGGVLFSKIMAKMRGEQLDEGLGFGDVYISIMAGFLIGFSMDVLSVLIFAILLGGGTSLLFLIYKVVRKNYQVFTFIPYAPFIILATIILMYKQGS